MKTVKSIESLLTAAVSAIRALLLLCVVGAVVAVTDGEYMAIIPIAILLAVTAGLWIGVTQYARNEIQATIRSLEDLHEQVDVNDITILPNRGVAYVGGAVLMKTLSHINGNTPTEYDPNMVTMLQNSIRSPIRGDIYTITYHEGELRFFRCSPFTNACSKTFTRPLNIANARVLANHGFLARTPELK